MATVDPQNNIQAAGVPCQAFIGYFINDISKNESIRKEGALLKSINKFCPQYDKFSLIFSLLNFKSYQVNSFSTARHEKLFLNNNKNI